MSKKIKYLLVLAGLLGLMAGCGKDSPLEELFKEPDIGPVKKVLKTAMPLSYAANVAMATMQGTSLPNVTMLRSGDTSSVGCFLMSIVVDSLFPLPGNMAASGTILVAGFNARTDMAMMTVMFTGLNAQTGSFSIQNVSTFPVVRHTDIISGKTELLVVYMDIDVNAASDTLVTVGMSDAQVNAEFARYEKMSSFDSSVAVDENAWIISIDNHGTIGNSRDDQYVIGGGGQYVAVSNGESDICQLTMVNMTMTPVCRLNPVAGWALIQNIGVSSGTTSPPMEAGHVYLTCTSACNGSMEITAATGVYSNSWGNTMPLNLGN